MLVGIERGHSEYVVLALLAEMYFVAGVDFWFAGWERSLGLITTCMGFLAFAAVFPGALLIEQAWPRSPLASDLFGISAFSVAVGMILIVLEEDARSARQTTEEYQLTFDTNPHPLWMFDTEKLEFLAVNQAACAEHGYTREEFGELRLPDILAKGAHLQILGQVGRSTANPNGISRHIRKDGGEMPMDVTTHQIVFHGRPAQFVLGIDVSEREELERQVQHPSRHDPLTGLPNRVLFEEQLKGALARSLDAKEKLAILFINLDHFKRINDTYGMRLFSVGSKVDFRPSMCSSNWERLTASRSWSVKSRCDWASAQDWHCVRRTASSSQSCGVAPRARSLGPGQRAVDK